MPKGIIIFGPNGSGKTTIGRELAQTLNYKFMDIEDYHFIKSKIPYTLERSREDCLKRMLSDIQEHQTFILSAVTGDFGEEITSMYQLAVLISAPLEIRIDRIKQRTHQQYGDRVKKGGDMYEQNTNFINYISKRPLTKINQWSQTLKCPLLKIDGTKPIPNITKTIKEQYLSIQSSK